MANCSADCSKGSTFNLSTLAELNRPGFMNNFWKKPTGSLLCALCVWYLQPAPFFANKAATASVPGTNVSSVTTAAKKTKPDQPKQPSGRRHVANHVTVAQRVDKYGRCGLHNNNVGRRCIIDERTASRATIPPPLHAVLKSSSVLSYGNQVHTLLGYCTSLIHNCSWMAIKIKERKIFQKICHALRFPKKDCTCTTTKRKGFWALA